MKLEKGSFYALNSIETPVLNDPTLSVDRVVTWVDGTNKSHGYDDLTQQVCAYGNGTTTKSDRSVYVHDGTNILTSGKCTRFDVGEFDMSFDSYNGELINFLAIED